MVNNRLWGHPAWEPNLATLRRAGAILVDIQTGELDLTPVTSGTGEAVVGGFNPTWVTSRLRPPR